MESSLHRELKQFYAAGTGQVEVSTEGFRIDVVLDGVLIEIQHGSLRAIRPKVQQLLDSHPVHVVKPIVARKHLIKLARRNGRVAQTRLSPKRGSLFDLFGELVYFTQVFPHPRLTLEAVLVEVEEVRYPRRGNVRGWRRNYHVQDIRLLKVMQSLRLTSKSDLLQLLPEELKEPFDTRELAEAMRIPRWQSQQVAYCCRNCGVLQPVGKSGNSRLYRRTG